ncbi:TIGR04222 domain-containing membrane protein [Chitinolyticbacter albus]|uniref:TIGR04222 domain-containing membrane protein n=1 Tax=Chitinolyticbacter albus TaxID=2961951 RepID=UPI00210925CC|nr:TIGR04222 domain-containing membrane protein [Chitinolyticbacter albus]
MPLSPEQRDIWHRLESYMPGGYQSDNLFVGKLAEQQGWPYAEAMAALDEYRRFVLLAATSDKELAPSVRVDAVWHLHLLHTHDYWEHFCPNVLGRTLHHRPYQPEEIPRLGYRPYSTTLQRYREAFDSEPPSDIWPARLPSNVTATPDAALPERPVPWADRINLPLCIAIALIAACWLIGLLTGVGLAAMSGPRFMSLALPIWLSVWLAYRANLRFWAWLDRRDPIPATTRLPLHDLAYLADGARRQFRYALAILAQRKAIGIIGKGYLSKHQPEPALPHPLLAEFHHLLLPGDSPSRAFTRSAALARHSEARLAAAGLRLPRKTLARRQRAIQLLLLALLLLGVIRISVGLETGHAVFGMTVIWLMGLVYFSNRLYWDRRAAQITESGQQVLDDALQQWRERAGGQTDIGHTLQAVALLGALSLFGRELENWAERAHFHDDPEQTWVSSETSGSSGDGGSDGSSADGGSSDGGSSCGGGGCGGCGGGGGD